MRSTYFKEDELACKCCGKLVISDMLVDMLDSARTKAGIPFVITSGYRCESHNKEVGGSKSSSHLEGLAVDIGATNSVERGKILRALFMSGFSRVGIAKTFIHVDVDYTKVKPVTWMYS